MKSEVSLECLRLESVAPEIRIAALRAGPSRITMRLFNEARSALAYLRQHPHAISGTLIIDEGYTHNFPIIAVLGSNIGIDIA